MSAFILVLIKNTVGGRTMLMFTIFYAALFCVMVCHEASFVSKIMTRRIVNLIMVFLHCFGVTRRILPKMTTSLQITIDLLPRPTKL